MTYSIKDNFCSVTLTLEDLINIDRSKIQKNEDMYFLFPKKIQDFININKNKPSFKTTAENGRIAPYVKGNSIFDAKHFTFKF